MIGPGRTRSRAARISERITSELPRLFVSGGVGVLALLFRLSSLTGPHAATPGGDSDVFLALADRLIHSLDYVGDFRPPAYSAFLAGLSWLPGTIPDAAVIAQHLLAVGTVVGLVYAAWKIIRVGAVVVGITLATSTFLVSAESWVLADALLGIATTWFVWMVATSWYPESDSKRPLILAGLIGGLCILLKGEGLFITAGVAFAFLINMLLSFRRVPIRKSFTAGLAIAAGLVALVLPWMIRNQVQYGRPSISSLGGQAMFYRVFDSALLRPVEPGPGEYVLAAEQRLADGQGVTNEGFREALGPRIEEYEELLLDAVKEEASFSRTWQTYIYMRTSGLSMHETLGAMQQAATASASAAKSQFKTAVERSLGDGLTLMREPATAEVQSALGLSERMTNPVDRLPPVLFQPWVLLVAGAGALFGRGKSATVALFAGWAFIAERLGVAIFHGGDPRYVAHVIGASALLVTFGWIGLLDRLWAIGASLRNRFSKSLTPERSWS